MKKTSIVSLIAGTAVGLGVLGSMIYKELKKDAKKNDEDLGFEPNLAEELDESDLFHTVVESVEIPIVTDSVEEDYEPFGFDFNDKEEDNLIDNSENDQKDDQKDDGETSKTDKSSDEWDDIEKEIDNATK